eukprot:1155838-Pelagomonas_calceolata.AAC.3
MEPPDAATLCPALCGHVQDPHGFFAVVLAVCDFVCVSLFGCGCGCLPGEGGSGQLIDPQDICNTKGIKGATCLLPHPTVALKP